MIQRYHLSTESYLPYVAFGDPDGAPLLVLRGIGDGLATLEDGGTAETLVERYEPYREYQVIAPSWRIPAHAGLSLDTVTSDIAGLLRHLAADSAFVWGISMGGMVAQTLAVQYPDMVRALILEATSAYKGSELDALVQRWKTMAEMDRWAALQRDTLNSIFTGRFPWAYRRMALFPGRIPIPTDRLRFGRLADSMKGFDMRDRLSAIASPTLVIGGKSDIMIPPHLMVELAEGIPGARLVMVNKCGHGASLERPEEFDREILAFIAEHRGRC